MICSSRIARYVWYNICRLNLYHVLAHFSSAYALYLFSAYSVPNMAILAEVTITALVYPSLDEENLKIVNVIGGFHFFLHDRPYKLWKGQNCRFRTSEEGCRKILRASAQTQKNIPTCKKISLKKCKKSLWKLHLEQVGWFSWAFESSLFLALPNAGRQSRQLPNQDSHMKFF